MLVNFIFFDNWKWNVPPLFGDFGGRPGIFYFFIGPSFSFNAPSLFICYTFFSFFTSNVCMHACSPEGLPKGAAFFDQFKGGCDSITPLNLINSFVAGV